MLNENQIRPILSKGHFLALYAALNKLSIPINKLPWFGILFGRLHTVPGILRCEFSNVDVGYAFLWNPSHIVNIETLDQAYEPEKKNCFFNHYSVHIFQISKLLVTSFLRLALLCFWSLDLLAAIQGIALLSGKKIFLQCFLSISSCFDFKSWHV